MLSTEDLKRRKDYIGASDAPAIMGFVPQRNAADVFYEKTNPKIEPQEENLDDFDPDAMESGHIFENMLLDFAARRVGIPKIERQLWIPEGYFAATLDGLGKIEKRNVVLEAKSSGIGNPSWRRSKNGWGDPGTDQIPDKVRVQTHVQMKLANADIAYVPALLGDDGGLRLYVVEYDSGFANIIWDTCSKFWEENVLKGIPPENVTPSEDTLKEMDRVQEKEVEIDDHLMKRYLEAKEQSKDWGKLEKELKAEILSAMGDAEVGISESGRITYFEQSRSGLDQSRLKKEWPELYEKFEKTSTFRVFRSKANG